MNVPTIGRVSRLAVIGMLLLGSASCVNIDENLGGNFIPTDQIWNVFPCEARPIKDITLAKSDSLSGYSTGRFTFGAVNDGTFTCLKSTSFTLVPLSDTLDFGKETGEYPKVVQFHLSAARDTLSMVYDDQRRMLQNVYVYKLKEPLDSNILYTNVNLKELAVPDETITAGIPVYNGGDSLSIDFSEEYGKAVIEGIKEFQSLDKEKREDIANYLKYVPGIVMTTDPQDEAGGRINMFELAIQTESGYITGNYAELKFRGIYDYSSEPVDTSFLFFFGPADFLKDDDVSYPTQFAFNASQNTESEDFLDKWENGTKELLYIEGGSGLKPVIKASEIKKIVRELIQEKEDDTMNSIDTNEVVINKATIILPYNVGTDYEKLDKYPMILSPTVRLTSDDGKHITYAGLTDSSIESENHGDINRSLGMYCPDISHHVQEILNLKKGEGEDVPPDETDADFEKRLEKYDIWMLIMHEEITETSSGTGAYDDYYNNLLYNSYYNNMMYDPYGYGYGYGYGGYGYGYGGYGYNNYYNYYMMAAYANASSSSTTTSSSIELDKDRFYNAVINGPGAAEDKPSLKITFSAPKKAEQ